MNITRFFIVFVLAMCLSGTVLFAQTAQPSIPVAEVNISGAKIADQLSGVLNISFSITNGTGVQSGVKYGVRLTPKGKPNTIIDEKTFDEALTLDEHASVYRSVVYTVPSVLSGDYDVYVISNSATGFPFSVSRAGTATVTATVKGIELLSESCLVTTPDKKSYQLSEGVQIAAADTLQLSCTAINHGTTTAALLPTTVTYARSIYGSTVEHQGGTVVPVVLKAGEKKLISFAVPTATKPGPYIALTSLSFGGQESNRVRIQYGVVGAPASIINVATDQDHYRINDTAKLSLLWIGGSSAVVDTKITSWQNVLCGAVSKDITAGPQTIEVPITKSCINPSIMVTLKDTNGTVFDTRTFSVQTVSMDGSTLPLKSILIILGVLIAIIIIAVLLKRRGGTTPKTVLPALILAAVFVIPFANAHATTYPLGSTGVFATVTIDNLNNPASTTYMQGDIIKVDGSIWNGSQSTQTVSLTAVTVGNNQVNLFPSSITLLGGATQQGNTQYLTVNVPTAGTPPVAIPGTYQVTFTAGIEEAPNGCWAKVEAEYVAFRWAKFHYYDWNPVTQSYVNNDSGTTRVLPSSGEYELQNCQSTNPTQPFCNDDPAPAFFSAGVLPGDKFNQTYEIAGVLGHTGFNFTSNVLVKKGSQTPFVVPQQCTQGYH